MDFNKEIRMGAIKITDKRRKRTFSLKCLTSSIGIILLLCLGTFLYIAWMVHNLYSTKDVAFAVGDVHHTFKSDKPETLIFTSVSGDTSKSYDVITGHYVISSEGTYMLMAQICSYVTSTFPFSDLYLSITVEDVVRGSSHVDHNTVNQTICARVSAVEVMRKGEHAYVSAYRLNPSSQIDPSAINTFVGSRI